MAVTKLFTYRKFLQEKFDGATEVAQQRISSRRQLVPINPNYKPHTNADLVYLQNSPDFCERNLEVSLFREVLEAKVI